MRQLLAVILAWAALLALAPLSPAGAFEGPAGFSELAQQASQPVVNISTVMEIEGGMPFEFHPPGPQGGPWEDFFEQFERFFGTLPEQPRTQNSLGSGFIITSDGYIVTNAHVVEKATQITVTIREPDEEYEAKVVGRDPETDLALLKIEATNLPVLPLGDSDKAVIGSWVVAIGNPFGLDHTVTAGIISAKGRIIGAGSFDDFIQTDASINPGNSGGPLLNLDGEVVGINTAIVAAGQGIGFAIPSNAAKPIIAQLKEHGKVTRGWLGVTIQPVDANTAKALGLPEPRGALVASVVEGQPAAKAGIGPGDVILAVEGTPIKDVNELLRLISGMKPGEKVTLTVFSKGAERKVPTTLATRSTELLAESTRPGKESETEGLGLAVRPVTEPEARALGLDKATGLLVAEVGPASPAAEAGVQQGDVILQANQTPVGSVKELQRIVDQATKKTGVVLLLLSRQGNNLFVSVELSE